MKPTIISVILLLSCAVLFAQEEGEFQNWKSRRASLNLSYNGNNLWNPGLNLGLEQVWRVNTKVTKKNKERKSLDLLDLNLAFYRDYSQQTPVYLTAGWVHRRQFNSGFHWQFGIHPLGIYRSFLPETWEVTSAGVEQVRFPGRTYYSPSISFGLGKNNKTVIPATGWFMNLNLMALTPYNTAFNLVFTAQVGYRIPLGISLFQHSNKEKHTSQTAND